MKHRKEVHLTKTVIKDLKKRAKADERSLMNYMEKVLIDDSKKS